MKHLHRPLLLAALLVFGAASAGAQTAAAPPAVSPNPATAAVKSAVKPSDKPSDKPTGRPDRTIERIRTEDAGSRIDELRVGGETQSITVQPAANVPAYEVRPMDASRAGSGSAADSGNTGSRVWNVLKF